VCGTNRVTDAREIVLGLGTTNSIAFSRITLETTLIPNSTLGLGVTGLLGDSLGGLSRKRLLKEVCDS